MKRALKGPGSVYLAVVLLAVLALFSCRIGVDDPVPQQTVIQEDRDAELFLSSLTGR